MNSVISFVIVLGLLIFVHEFGHFLFAKLFGVRVLKFSLGFGPKVVGFQKGDTEYLVSAFPLGGYVKMFGESPLDEVEEPEQYCSFTHKPVWQRFIIVAGGPLFNLLFAVLLFFLIFASLGMPQASNTSEVGHIGKDSPAAQAGLKVGDVILTINDKATMEWTQVSQYIRSSEGEIVLTVLRDKEELTLTAKPKIDAIKNEFGEVIEERRLLGIMPVNEIVKVSLLTSFKAGLNETWRFIRLTVLTVVKMINKVVPMSELGGPIRIAQIAGQQMEAGWINLVYFMGLLSVNLGVLNLFPIPILDGGHLVFFTVEAIRRKPLSMKTREMFQQIGLFLLVSLMFFVFYNDIVQMFFKK